MAEGQGQRGQVEAAMQELSSAASAEAVCANARCRPPRVCQECGGHAAKLAGGGRPGKVRLRGQGLPQPRPEIREAMDEEPALIEALCQVLDVGGPSGHSALLGPVPREGGSQARGKDGEDRIVQGEQSEQAVAGDC